MRTYILAIATAALFAIPTAAFSETIEFGPGGVRIGPNYGHHRLYNRYEGGRCAELRQACLHKEELGEQTADSRRERGQRRSDRLQADRTAPHLRPRPPAK